MEKWVEVVSAEVVTGPRYVGGSPEEMTLGSGPMKLVKETEKVGEP